MIIAGVDEVGRGCLAGPVVAAAVILNNSIDSLNDSKKLLQITDKVYSIGSKSNEIANLSYVSLNSPELDSILIMCKFYPWIIKYSKLKKLDPDNPRYLTKITHTL